MEIDLVLLCAGRGKLPANVGEVFSLWNEGVGRNFWWEGLDEFGECAPFIAASLR